MWFNCSTIAVWNVQRKKPLVCVNHHNVHSPSTVVGELWVTAVATLPFTDLIASGEHLCSSPSLSLLGTKKPRCVYEACKKVNHVMYMDIIYIAYRLE